jgi:hypothetical protein
MVQTVLILRYNILSLLLLTCSSYSFAQTPLFALSSNASKIGVKDQLQVTFTIKDMPNVTEFFPAGIESDFKIMGGPYQSQSMDTYIANNHAIQSVSIHICYLLQAKHEGLVTIPAGVAKDATGHIYKSNPLMILVIPGSLSSIEPNQVGIRCKDKNIAFPTHVQAR